MEVPDFGPRKRVVPTLGTAGGSANSYIDPEIPCETVFETVGN
jgi:hypothetical protein